VRWARWRLPLETGRLVFENFRFCDRAMARNAVGARLRGFYYVSPMPQLWYARSATLGVASRNSLYAHHRARLWRTRRGETRSSVVFERSAVTGDRVCLALYAFPRALSRGARRELAGTRRFRRSRWGHD